MGKSCSSTWFFETAWNLVLLGENLQRVSDALKEKPNVLSLSKPWGVASTGALKMVKWGGGLSIGSSATLGCFSASRLHFYSIERAGFIQAGRSGSCQTEEGISSSSRGSFAAIPGCHEGLLSSFSVYSGIYLAGIHSFVLSMLPRSLLRPNTFAHINGLTV
jgi:hypothetical protein